MFVPFTERILLFFREPWSLRGSGNHATFSWDLEEVTAEALLLSR